MGVRLSFGSSYLRHILDKGDSQFYIGAHIDKSEPCHDCPDAEANEHYQQQCCKGKEPLAIKTDLLTKYYVYLNFFIFKSCNLISIHLLVISLIDEALQDGDSASKDGV